MFVGKRTVLALVAFGFGTIAICGSQSASAQPEHFRDLSPRDRAAWFETLGPAMSHPAPQEAAEPPAFPPADYAALGASDLGLDGWYQLRGGIKWRIDPEGFVTLSDGQRPTGSRLFARSCFMRYGKSFQRWTATYGKGLGVAHLVATAVTESGCSQEKGMSSVDGLSTGIMQVTGTTCQSLLRRLGQPALSKNDCMMKMADDPDFSVELGAAYITQPTQIQLTSLNPPKVAAAYNAGALYFDPVNPWHLHCTGNHIDRFVAAYNAYVAWYREEGGDLAAVTRRRGAAGGHVKFMRGLALPEGVPSLTALKELTSSAQEGAVVFVGDWNTKRGDFYVFVDGQWQGSLDEASR
jgi:hypothetical protein